jgi:eukaryotic-like serine/threonine-protein kinase
MAMSDPDIVQSSRSGVVYRLGHPFRLDGFPTYEAQDSRGRRCWVKQVPSDDEAAIARLRYEAIILGKLEHPSVIRLIDRGRTHAFFFLVLEQTPGHSLRQVMEAAPLPLPLVYSIAAQLADALAYLHTQGIICCMLPPEHLYLDHLGRIVLVDFSAAWDEVAPVRRADTVEHTAYISPEQAGGAAVERRSDIYAYGTLLFELLTGKPPFGGGRGDLALQHLLAPPPDPRALRPDIPPALAALVNRCLAKAPAQRYEQASALIAALRTIEQPANGTPEHRSEPPASLWKRLQHLVTTQDHRLVEERDSWRNNSG